MTGETKNQKRHKRNKTAENIVKNRKKFIITTENFTRFTELKRRKPEPYNQKNEGESSVK